MAEAHKRSRLQEDRTAQKYNGSRNAMSGAGWMRKGDVRSMKFMIENKLKLSTEAKSYSLKAIDLRDLTKRAVSEGRIPLMQIDLGGHRYVVLREDDFVEMIENDISE